MWPDSGKFATRGDGGAATKVGWECALVLYHKFSVNVNMNSDTLNYCIDIIWSKSSGHEVEIRLVSASYLLG
jgi:hypothetical protein